MVRAAPQAGQGGTFTKGTIAAFPPRWETPIHPRCARLGYAAYRTSVAGAVESRPAPDPTFLLELGFLRTPALRQGLSSVRSLRQVAGPCRLSRKRVQPGHGKTGAMPGASRDPSKHELLATQVVGGQGQGAALGGSDRREARTPAGRGRKTLRTALEHRSGQQAGSRRDEDGPSSVLGGAPTSRAAQRAKATGLNLFGALGARTSRSRSRTAT